jgi:hypothetical protein
VAAPRLDNYRRTTYRLIRCEPCTMQKVCGCGDSACRCDEQVILRRLTPRSEAGRGIRIDINLSTRLLHLDVRHNY